jgi:folate-binding protein YgfZ
MITDMTVVAGAAGLYMAVPSDAAASLAVRLDKSIFSEAAEVADVSADTAHFSVTGPEARAVLDASLAAIGAQGDPAVVTWNSDELGLKGADAIVPSAIARELGAELEERAVALAPEARRVLRIEAGRPEFGVDMTGDTIPLEANLLDRAISTTKGCYVGQEVIIRVLHRGGGRVAKRLAVLRFEGGQDAVPPAGTPLSAGGRDVGRVTSAVWSPRAEAIAGLGYVHRDVLDDEDAILTLPDGRAVSITSS